jgi:hypothetical protein
MTLRKFKETVANLPGSLDNDEVVVLQDGKVLRPFFFLTSKQYPVLGNRVCIWGEDPGGEKPTPKESA